MIEQVRLCAVWPTENWDGSPMNHILGWMTVWGCWCHALEKRCLAWQYLRNSSRCFENSVGKWNIRQCGAIMRRSVFFFWGWGWNILRVFAWWSLLHHSATRGAKQTHILFDRSRLFVIMIRRGFSFSFNEFIWKESRILFHAKWWVCVSRRNKISAFSIIV